MAVTKRANGVLRDKGYRLEADAKDIRGINGAEIYTRAPQFFDHFLLPQTMATNWVSTVTGTTPTFAILNAGMGGVAEQLTSATSGDSIVSTLIQSGSTGSGFNPSKNALERPISFEARVILGQTSACEVFMGFLDSGARATSINYALSATSTFGTSTAADGVAVGYSSVPTSGNAFLTGGNPFVVASSIAGVDSVASTGLVADTSYHVFRIEVDVNGNATVIIDDKIVKYVGGALTANTNIYPFFQTTTRGAATKKTDIDYVLVSAGLASTIT